MKQTQTVGVAIQYMRQAFLGITDFTYEDKYDSISKKDIMQVAKDLYVINQLPFPEGSHFIASFTHLNGYAANYYGYLWSKVFAEDMFDNGIGITDCADTYFSKCIDGNIWRYHHSM